MTMTADDWGAQLRAFIASVRKPEPLRDGHMLDALSGWQRRITGGALLDFLSFAGERAHAQYPRLGQNPITERVFVCITDEPGAVAARELIDRDSPRALWLFRSEWLRFLEAPEQDQDEAMAHHFEFWSVWHRNIPDTWQLPREQYRQLWVHEEGFALDEGLGRGSQHVWGWDGATLRLVEQDITRWVEAPDPEEHHHH